MSEKWLNLNNARDTEPEMNERVRSFVEKYGDVGRHVLNIFNEIDFAHSGMPDEYLSYARRFMEHIKDKGEKPTEEEIDQAVDASFTEDQREKFYKKEIEQIKTAIYFRVYYSELVDMDFEETEQISEIGLMQIDERQEMDDVTFSFPGSGGNRVGYLQCEIDRHQNIFTARAMAVEEEYQRRGLGKQMFIAAIEYAKSRGYKFETDGGVSDNASKMIESLAADGYYFTKNPNLVEREAAYGKRFVSQNGSPIYKLIE